MGADDSGQPVLFALDTRGSVSGRVRLSGVALEDWEAVVVGPCPGGSCVYVADIGDNAASRKRIAIYRFPEPEGFEASVAVTDVFHATYPDGGHDAEALLVTPDGGLFIVTKGDSGAVALYRFRKTLALAQHMRSNAWARRMAPVGPVGMNESLTVPCPRPVNGSCCALAESDVSSDLGRARR